MEVERSTQNVEIFAPVLIKISHFSIQKQGDVIMQEIQPTHLAVNQGPLQNFKITNVSEQVKLGLNIIV